jgi:HlyD family secretion protein
MKRKFIAVVVVIGVVAVAGALAIRGMNRDQRDRIPISGNIELTAVNIAFKTAGKLVERAVDEGDPVKKGMVLARLDRDQLLRMRERERAALLSAEAQLAQAGTAVQWQRDTVTSDLEQRRADLKATEARLRELQTGSRPQEIQEAQAAVEAARAEQERARKDWDRAQVLYKNDDISTSQYDQFRTRFESATAAFHQAQQRLALVQEGPRKETIEAARAQVARSRASLKAGEANQLEIRRREQELATRRAEIERARAQLAVVDSQLADTVAISPIDGVVLVKSADVGEVLAPGTTVVTVGDIDHPWLRGYINERDLGKVKLGNKVKVSTDSFPDKVYWGRLSFIASEAEFTPKQIQTKEERVKLVYRIKIDIANPQRELKSNMPADAQILLNER